MGCVLDSLDQAWGFDLGGRWSRLETWDPPLPLDGIRFWSLEAFVSTDNEVWWFNQENQWVSLGHWPGPAGADETPISPFGSSNFPNPTSGPCRISFQVKPEGPVTVRLVDASGRVVRRMLDGAHPAGDYSLIWNGQDDNGRDLPAGVYFTHIQTKEKTTTGRVVLARKPRRGHTLIALDVARL
jgi:hypothetical protein